MKRHQQSSENGQVMRGAFLGIIIGGLVALWNAPRSGKETRRRLLGRLMVWRTLTERQMRSTVEKIQGEPIATAIEQGKAIAHQQKSIAARSLPAPPSEKPRRP